jgi:hypothetical protein
MAEGLNIQDTTYSGSVASYMMTRAVVGADTIEKGGIMVQDGIRKKFNIPRVEISGFMQKRQATPVSKGNVNVDGKIIEPKDLMLYVELNPRDFEAHYYAEKQSPKLLTRELPQTAEAFIMMQQMKRLNEFFENAIHRSRIDFDPSGNAVDPTSKGEVAGAVDYNYFDGLIKKALDDVNTIQVPTPIALTTANIRDKWTLALNLVPAALLFKYGKGGLKFLVSYADKLKYEEALRTDTYKNIDSTESAIERFRGYDIVSCAGIPENTFYLCIARPDNQSNLWLGINSTEDNQLQLSRLQNNSELFFIKGLFKMDTQIGFADQLVIYTTLTA